MTPTEKTRAWRKANPERYSAANRDHYQRNRTERPSYSADPERRAKKAARMKAARAADPDGSRLKFRAWNYGLTVEAVKALLEAGCAACGSTENLHVDRDHRCCPTGSSPRSCGRCVRGALCNGCNTALGLLGEDPGRIAALLAYTQKRASVGN